MLTQDQAKAASDALLDEPRKLQVKRVEKIKSASSKPRVQSIKWQVTGALVGLLIGTLLEYFITHNVTFWGVIGVAAGWAAGIALDSYREA